MKLSKIDLTNIVAINHVQDKLGLLIDRGSEIEYLEIPAPKAAYQGLNQVANIANHTSSVPSSSISRLDSQTLYHPFNITNEPKSVTYGASVEVDQHQNIVRVELSCELIYSLEDSSDFEDEDEEFYDFDEDFGDEYEE